MQFEFEKLSKIGAVSLLLLVLALIWLFLVVPYTDYFSARVYELERTQRKLLVLEDLIIKKDSIKEKYRAMKNNRSLERVYLARKGGVLAEAKLQGVVRRLIEKNGSTLTQSSVKKTDDAGAKSITMKVSMRGSIESTYKVFHALENGWPVVVVRNAELTLVNPGYSQTKNNNMLSSVYEVTAYVQ